MPSITSSNAVYMLGITGLYPTPQQLEYWGVDEMFETDALVSAETQMGVDGHLSGGYIYNEVKQTLTFMADSPSCLIFDNWYASQKSAGENLIANGVIVLKGPGSKYALTRGFLASWTPIPSARKVLQARKFAITWESVQAAPI
jgi:hypothetical protein